ncbi:MAG: MFS transporter [Gammaproteobacteria bacterium]|nr:MFS transporter [Gammaproteobacteria bacterium]
MMQPSPSPVPYWRLSGFYLFYFATLGVLIPYWGLYLKSLGFNAASIGELMAIIMATKIVAPNVWAWIADYRGHRMAIVRLASLLALLAFAGVFLGDGYWWLAAVMSVFSFFWNAALPQFEATTLTHLGEKSHRYTSIRIWGSIGFIVAVVVLGPQLDARGAGILPPVLVALMAGIWVMSLVVPERAAGHRSIGHQPLSQVLRRPEVLALIVGSFLMQASHGPYYAFYSIYLEEHGHSRSLIGQLWALGVLAEVVLYAVMHRLLPRFGLRSLFLLSLALTTLRWVVIGLFPLDLPLLTMAQVLHLASFGIYHAVAIQLFHRYFVGRNQGRGQALYSSLSFGAGGALGSLLAGYMWDGAGPAATFFGAAVVSATAWGIVWRWLDGEEARPLRPSEAGV